MTFLSFPTSHPVQKRSHIMKNLLCFKITSSGALEMVWPIQRRKVKKNQLKAKNLEGGSSKINHLSNNSADSLAKQ